MQYREGRCIQFIGAGVGSRWLPDAKQLAIDWTRTYKSSRRRFTSIIKSKIQGICNNKRGFFVIETS